MVVGDGEQRVNLYVAIVDSFIQAFLQVVAYYQYLKGGNGSMGLRREKLKLGSIQRKTNCIDDLGVL